MKAYGILAIPGEPASDSEPPSVPQGLAGSATSVPSVVLTWTASTDNVAVAGYQVYRNGVPLLVTSGTTATDTTVVDGQFYTYQVSAFDDAGNGSALSDSVGVQVGTAVVGRIEFAEIADIVFIRGYVQSADLGPFLIDPANRWTPGDLTNAAGWVSRVAVALLGVLPGELAYSDTSMRLDCNGTGTGHASYQFTLSTQGKTSRSFKVWVLDPDITWGYGGEINLVGHVGNVANTDAVSWQQMLLAHGNPAGITCVLVKSGTYLNKTGTSVGWFSQVQASGKVFIVGEPTGRPVLEYQGVSFNLSPDGGERIVFENIEIDGTTPTTTNQGWNLAIENALQAIVRKVKVSQTLSNPFERTRMGDTPAAGTVSTYLAGEHFYIGCELRRTGRTAHGGYWKNGAFNNPYDQQAAFTFANRTLTHVNLCDFGATPAGHTLKLEGPSTVRNTWVHGADDLTDPALTQDDISENAPVNIHVNHRTILYNSRVDHVYTSGAGQRWPIYTASRNSAEGGQTLPPYWGQSVIATNPSTHANVAAALAGELFHGSGAALGTVYASPPTDVPWWNLVAYRPQGDRLATHRFAHWLAYNDIRYIDVSDRLPNQLFNSIAHRLDSSAVHQQLDGEPGSTLHYYLNVPRNWATMSGAYLLNNLYTGFDLGNLHVVNDGFGFVADSQTVYPECVLPYPINTLTVLSGEPSQTDAAIPDWFVLSYDALPTYALRTAADALAAGGSAVFATGLTNAQLNITAGPSTVMAQAAANLNPVTHGFSDPVTYPIARADLQVRLLRPIAATLQYPPEANNKKSWHWGGKGCWSSTRKRLYVIHSPANETGTLSSQLLTVYDEATDKLRVYEDPLGRHVSHMYDNTALDGDLLYKWTGQPTGDVRVVDVSQIDIDDPVSAQASGAFVEAIAHGGGEMANGAAAAMDIFPGIGLCWFQRNAIRILNTSTKAWGTTISTGVAIGETAIHGMAHYNPDWDCLVFGGGSNSATGISSLKWFVLDRSLTVTPLQDSPVVMSVNNDMPTHKCCACHVPFKSRSAFYHQDGNIYLLDKNAPINAQWVTLSAAMDPDNGEERFCVPARDYPSAGLGLVILAHYGINGASAVRLWKLA